jgi:hypothetical protein
MQRAVLLLFVGAFIPRAAAAQGDPLGPEFRVNTFTTALQDNSAVASDASGNFVVVWQSFGQDGSYFGVFGQRYDSSGVPLGPEFRVNAQSSGQQRNPSVASDSTGNFIVVWDSYPQDGFGGGIFGRRYASSGAALGPEFRVNTAVIDNQYFASVASDSSGNFVVVWESWGHDGDNYGVFGQRYASSGTPLGPEFRVNTYTTNYQRRPSVAADALGNFVVAWGSQAQDASDYGVFAQRFGQIVPVELMNFRVE